MPICINMPSLSPTMESGKLAKWAVSEGDNVNSGGLIAEIETDKAVMDFQGGDDGTVERLLVAEGSEEIPVGSPIALLREKGDSDDDVAAALADAEQAMQSGGGGGDAPQDTQAAPQAETQQHATAQANTAPPATDGGRVSASPVARRIAAEAGIDLRSLRGSGPYGRIVKADVESALQTGAPISKAPIDIEPSSMRRIVAERMTHAKQTVPHFYLESECHTDALVTTLRAINQSRTEDDPKVTFNDLLISCMAYAFKRVPEANVAWVDGKIRKFQQVDVSIAVASDEGLMTQS